jgi:hypothetical protein
MTFTYQRATRLEPCGSETLAVAGGIYNNNGKHIATDIFMIKGLKSATVVPLHPAAKNFK